MYSDYYEIENELYEYDSDQQEDELEISPEDWQDLHSNELLDVWFSIVEYHEEWYLPIKKTFNEFCEFVYNEPTVEIIVPEIQAVKNHKFVKGRDWTKFFL